MRAALLCVGKLKEKYWRDAIAEYEKRLRPYVKLEILEGSEEDAPENLSEREKERIMEKEGAFFLGKMKEGDYNIALDLCGDMVTSPQLAAMIENKGMMAGKNINFLIGGSLGLSSAVKAKCQKRIDFGNATFPHQMIRVFLTEQIYRSFKILRNEPYHK